MLQAADERPGESLRVLIVDDHDLFRTGLRNLLEEQGIQIVGEAASGAEAVRIVRAGGRLTLGAVASPRGL